MQPLPSKEQQPAESVGEMIHRQKSNVENIYLIPLNLVLKSTV